MITEPVRDKIRALERPHPALMTYYLILSICSGPGIVILLPILYFRYHTLRYRFDEEGLHMKVGILFRRETNLTYSRIQDIHLRSGILQRWLGLANVQIQTASGSAGPECVVEGFKNFEAIRDFLYTRMRGYQARQTSTHAPADPMPRAAASNAIGATPPGLASKPSSVGEAEVLPLLLGIRDELRCTRELLEARSQGPRPPQCPPPQTHPPSHV